MARLAEEQTARTDGTAGPRGQRSRGQDDARGHDDGDGGECGTGSDCPPPPNDDRPDLTWLLHRAAQNMRSALDLLRELLARLASAEPEECLKATGSCI